MPTSLTSKFLQGVGVTTLSSIAGFFVWTKHIQVNDLNPVTDPVFATKWYKKLNANGNPTLHDEVVRRLPLWTLRPELVEDAKNGGSKLVEGFSQGVWGTFGYSIQRRYLAAKYRNTTTTAHQLWDKPDLLSSPYNIGTEITDHFVVLDKTPTSILIRCGDSPLKSPDGQRPSDGLFEISAETDFDKGFAEFRLKSVFFQGEGVVEDKTKEPMDARTKWAHQQYAKLWMESAVRHVRS
ncbi:hypothetical protein PV10_04110 [Exophiala mesophila]|uniref:Uncharacterized protein n=1 Tax=Exophiala mesophila TaxID=212818 RepID=A0A0D1XX86_EXOME|nr:uncharacterized protein PV10_04110 [Exophiala mesophila]KIV92846.1 hypothetical protein PV10_04110 [Exophiala mesophila]